MIRSSLAGLYASGVLVAGRAAARLAAGALVASTMLVGCTGDEFTTGGGGGGGAAATSTPASSSTGDTTTTSSSGGTCAGCLDTDGACHLEQSVSFCGTSGVDCAFCPAGENPCQEGVCGQAGCTTRNKANLTACPGGACVDGVCDPDAEVCLNDVDEDGDQAIGCQDQDCLDAGHACSDGASGGFEGPVLVVAAPGEAPCPDILQEDGRFYTEVAGDCGCAAECAVDVVAGDATCTVSSGPERLLDGQCTELETIAKVTGLLVTPACVATSSPTTTVTTLTQCRVPSFGCNQGLVCMPPLSPPGAGENLLCLFTDDPDRECPEGWGALYETHATPEVTCECSCTPGADADACQGELRTWADGACSECGKNDQACETLAVPDGECRGVETSATHIILDVTNPGQPTIINAEPRLDGDADRRFCCQPYPQVVPG